MTLLKVLAKRFAELFPSCPALGLALVACLGRIGSLWAKVVDALLPVLHVRKLSVLEHQCHVMQDEARDNDELGPLQAGPDPIVQDPKPPLDLAKDLLGAVVPQASLRPVEVRVTLCRRGCIWLH